MRLVSIRTVAALVLATLGACAGQHSDQGHRTSANVLLVTIDTFRADRLRRGFTPALDQLAAGGLYFTNARSVAPLTLPAHTSIMTGHLPPTHGVRLNGTPWGGAGGSMATRLRDTGYQTAGVVGAFVLDRRFGLAAGFDHYDDQISRDPLAVDRLQTDRRAKDVVDHAIALLAAMSADRPWLLWVHVYDPHAPYDPPADARTRAGGDGYDGEIAYVDMQVSRLLAAAQSRPDAARLATLIMGDHGESLGDHGEETHGMLVFESAVRIPLIVRAPGLSPATRADPASLVDVLPTVLTLAGLPATGLPGRSLTAAPAPEAATYAESEYPSVAGWAPVRSLVQDRWKLVIAGRPRLFDLVSDPGETTDTAAAHAATVRAMTAHVDTLQRSAAGSQTPGLISAETAARLRALGYVSPSARPATDRADVDPAGVMAVWTEFERAQAAVAAGRAGGALPALARIARLHPSSPLFASSYAHALAAAGRSGEALAQFRKAVEQWPGDAELYHDLAVVARARGFRSEASRAEDAALAINPALPSAHHGKGLGFSDEGRHAEAARAFNEAVRHDPTNAVYQTDLGNARRALGDLDGAARAFTAALDRSPDSADAANGLGVVLVQQGRAAEAVGWFERAAADPTLIEAQLNLGIALQESGQPGRAREQYRIVLRAPGAHPKEKGAARALLAQLERR